MSVTGRRVYRHSPIFSKTEIFSFQNSKAIKYRTSTNLTLCLSIETISHDHVSAFPNSPCVACIYQLYAYWRTFTTVFQVADSKGEDWRVPKFSAWQGDPRTTHDSILISRTIFRTCETTYRHVICEFTVCQLRSLTATVSDIGSTAHATRTTARIIRASWPPPAHSVHTPFAPSLAEFAS